MIATIRIGILGFLIGALSVFAAEVPALPDEVQTAVDQWLTTRTPQEEDDWPVYQAALGHSEALEPVLAYLEEEASVNARWLGARLAWRYGLLQEAREGFAQLSEDTKAPAAAVRVAQLLDAEGKEAEAVEAYRSLLDDEKAAAWHQDLRLRLAILKSTGGKVEGELDDLKQHAESVESATFSNRAAVVLALAGKPQDALSLYQAGAEEPSQRFKQEIRVAEWAMAAKQHEKAQEAAWRALKGAKLKRDRRYALTILAESYRVADALESLVDRLAAEESLDEDSRFAWIDLLRELGKADEALALFKESTGDGESFTPEMRRQLLEICRETGREGVLIDAYREAITQQPQRLEWRAGLSRYYLENGDRERGEAVWQGFREAVSTEALLEAAGIMLELGLESMAVAAAEHCVTVSDRVIPALQFLFTLYRQRGMDEAMETVLQRMDDLAPPDSPDRVQLAESWEQMGRQDRAADVLERLRQALGEENFSPDLEMRLAWLYSETGNEDKAYEYWHSVWLRVDSPGRRRYVEDRLMATASRLGKLADIAIDLEEKLIEGRADKRDSGLLVRLYTKVGDPVSATEIVEEFFKQTGEVEREVLEEKARIYVMCNDYYHYEIALRRLMEIDPEGKPEYLTQLAMSCLERGKNDQAREVLTEMRSLEKNAASAEFEAGVLKIAGMHEEATQAYWRGIGENPNRIDAYLLLGESLRTVGKARQAQGVFQYLVEHADKDDLFTIAVDGLLNARVGPPVLRWARRVILERIAERDDKVYLYQLLGDLSEELRDQSMMVRALAETLPIAGERRTGQLRELVELSKVGVGGSSFASRAGGRSARDREGLMRYGRRLVGMGEAVPPQVHLDLGQAFLDGGDIRSAAKTFARATDLSDYGGFQRKVATSFEQKRYIKSALRVVEKLMLGDSGDVHLLLKLGELKEQLGEDEDANEAYALALDQLINVQPMVSATDDAPIEGQRYAWAQNQDTYDKYYARAMSNFLATAVDDEALDNFLEGQQGQLADELRQLESLDRPLEERLLNRSPRVHKRAAMIRRIALGFDKRNRVGSVHEALVKGFPDDERLLVILVTTLRSQGLGSEAEALLERHGSHPSADPARALWERTGGGSSQDDLFQMLLTGGEAEARQLLRRRVTDAGSQTGGIAGDLFGAARFLGDQPTMLRLARAALMQTPSEQVWGFTSILGSVWSQLEASDREVLVALVEDKLASLGTSSNRSLPYYIQQLNRLTGRDFRLGKEEVEDALQDALTRSGYYLNSIGALFNVLEHEDYEALLKEAYRKAKKSDRLQILFTLLKSHEGELGESLRELFAELVEDAAAASGGSLVEAWNKAQRYRYDERPQQLGFAADLLGSVSRGHTEEEKVNVQGVRAALLLQSGRTEEALEIAAEVQKVALLEEGVVDARTLQELHRSLLPTHLEVLLGAFEAALNEEGVDALALTKQQLTLIRRAGAARQDLLLRHLTAAADRFPDETSFQEEYRRILESGGFVWKAIQVQEALVSKEPKNVAARNRLATLWTRLEHPLKAQGAKELPPEEAPEEEAPAEEADKPKVTQSSSPSSPTAAAGSAVKKQGAGAVAGGATSASSSTVVQGLTAPKAPASGATPAVAARSSSSQASEESGAADTQSEEEKAEMLPVANMAEVKKASEAEEWDEARQVFRRVWRQFERLDQQRYYYPSNNNLSLFRWPDTGSSTSTARSASAVASSLGGMKRYLQATPAPAATPATPTVTLTIFDALGEEPAIRDEIERALRTLESNQLQGVVFAKQVEALVRARVKAMGLVGAIDAAVERLKQSADALPLEMAQHLALLDVATADEGDEVEPQKIEALREALFRRVRPQDTAAMRRLACCLARTGEREKAVRLYRWCAAKTTFSPYSYADGRLSTRVLVEDVRQFLQGDDLLHALEGIFALSRPVQQDARIMAPYYMMVLNTWNEVLPAEAALSRTRRICEEVIRDYPDNPVLVKLASVFLASGGAVDEGLVALKTALTAIPATTANGLIMVYNANGTVSYRSGSSQQSQSKLSEADLRLFFPESLQPWKAPGEWLEGLSVLTVELEDAGALTVSEATRVLALTAVHQQDLGEREAASETLSRLLELDVVASEDALWVWDAAQHLGRNEVWREVGKRLLQDRLLLIARVPMLIQEVARSEGVDAGLALAQASLAYTMVPELVSSGLALAHALGEPEAMDFWRERQAELLTDVENPGRYGFVVTANGEETLFRYQELADEREVRALVGGVDHALSFDPEAGSVEVRSEVDGEVVEVIPQMTLTASWRQQHPQGKVYLVTLLENAKTFAVERGAAGWRYYDDVAAPPQGWAAPDFDDASWKSGSAPLGYGESSVSTTLSFGGDASKKTLAAYFRKAVTVEDPSAWVKAYAELESDDGAIVYLNGKEVHRMNMRKDEADTHTTTAAGKGEKGNPDRFFLEVSEFKKGRNVIAISVHQADPQSSDLFMSLEIKVATKDDLQEAPRDEETP